jgi:hypothetical protein
LTLTLEHYLELALLTGGRFQEAYVLGIAPQDRERRCDTMLARMPPGWPAPDWTRYEA